MSRKPFIAGNWKMHNTVQQSVTLAAMLKNAQNKNGADICIAPSFTSLYPVAQAIKGSNVLLAAQDCHFEDKGAFTSAVSPAQVKDICTHVIIGHSERRSLFGDSDEILNKKVRAALGHGLKIIFCIGETLVERETEKTFQVLQEQIYKGLKDFAKEELKDLVIAYEPVWAIGTGRTATPEVAQASHKDARELLSQKFDAQYAQNIRLIYGGSVKADNVDALMAQPDIDGVLVGGQSLEADKFIRIIDYL
jgi:triosephosphate isomerase